MPKEEEQLTPEEMSEDEILNLLDNRDSKNKVPVHVALDNIRKKLTQEDRVELSKLWGINLKEESSKKESLNENEDDFDDLEYFDFDKSTEKISVSVYIEGVRKLLTEEDKKEISKLLKMNIEEESSGNESLHENEDDSDDLGYVDFTKGEHRKPIPLEDLNIPIYLDKDIRTQILKLAIELKISPKELINTFLKNGIRNFKEYEKIKFPKS